MKRGMTMTRAQNSWLLGYLRTLAEGLPFREARTVAPLWLAAERRVAPGQADACGPARLTIQMAAEVYQRLVVAGPAGAGKTTSLRQLASGLAEAILAAEERGGSRGQAQRGTEALPLPLYVELAHFSNDLRAALEMSFGPGAPPLDDLARGGQLLFLLDGLDELAPDAQLMSLSALARAFAGLGGQARWIITCRTENLPLFRPWLGTAEVRLVQPMRCRDALAIVQRQCGDELAEWLGRADDLASLATRPRWLSGLLALAEAGAIAAPFSRGGVLAAWIPAVVQAALAAHGWPPELSLAVNGLPALADALEQSQRESLPLDQAEAILADLQLPALAAERSRPRDGRADRSHPADDQQGAGGSAIKVLLAAGILTLDYERQLVSFRHPTLRAFAQGMLLAQSDPEHWPASALGRASSDAVVFAYSLCTSREAALRRLLTSGAVSLAVRCMIDAEPPERFDAMLARSVSLTPPLRVMIADAFAAEGMASAAREQLEQAGAEGYDEAGLFGRLGELYSAAGEWRLARAAYEQALARESDDLRYRQQLGVVYSRLGNLEQASAALESVLDAQQRRWAEAAHELGNVYLQLGRLERALEVFRQASVFLPREWSYRRAAAVALRRLGRLAEAEAELSALLEAGDTAPETFAEIGRVYAETGRHAEAEAALAKAVALEPGDASLYLQLGRLRHALGDYSAARAALRRAAELTPDDAELHYELGRVAESCGEYETALASFRHAIRLAPGNDRYLRALSALLHERGEEDEAVAVLRSVLELRPDSPEVLADLARLLWRGGRHEQALEAYRQALALAPDSVEIEHALGQALRQIGQAREALRHLRAAADRAPDRPDVQFDAAGTAEALEMWDEALERYERAVALAPDRHEYARAAAALHARAGNQPRARQLLARALRHARRDAATLYSAGLLHSSAGRWERAIAAFRRALRSAPDPQYADAYGQALLAAGRPDDACAVLSRALQSTPEDARLLLRYSQGLQARGELEAAYRAARQAAQMADTDPAALLHAGQLALQLGRWNEAQALLDHAATLAPQLGAAHLGRAQALLMLGQPETALTAARAAAEHAPESAEAALMVGLALERLGRDAEARPALERAVALQETQAPALTALRDICARTGDLEAAIRYARRVVDLPAASAEDLLRLGELLAATGALDEAQELFERALERGEQPQAPDVAPAAEAATVRFARPSHSPAPAGLVVARSHAGLGDIFARAGRWDRARWHAEQAIAQEPERAEHRALLARVLAGIGDARGAIAAYTAALERAPDRPDWQRALGDLYQAAGDHAAALPHLRRAAVLEPQPEHHYAAARSLRALGDLAGAAEALERALLLRPDAHQWRVELAEIYIERGWDGEAVAELGHVLASTPDDARLWRMRAGAHFRLRNLDAARADLVQALRRDGRDAASYALLARVLYEQSFDARALDAARRAVELEPAEPEHRALLARVLRALGRRAEAAAELQAALADGGPAAWWADLAEDWESLGETERAADAWRKAAEAAPGDATPRFRLGRLLAKAGDLRGAIQRLREAVSLRPDFASARARLAEMLIARLGFALLEAGVEAGLAAVMAKAGGDDQTGEPGSAATAAEALEHARQAVAQNPQAAEHWRALGAALRASGQTEEAVDALRRAHALDPADAAAAGLLGLALLESGEPEAAASAFAAASSAAPDAAEYHGLLGIAYQRLLPAPEDPAEPGEAAAEAMLARAREPLQRALALAPQDPRWWHALGAVEQAGGRHEEAIAAFDRALEDAERAAPEPDAADQAAGDEEPNAAADQMPAGAWTGLQPALSLETRRLRARSLYRLGRLAEARADLEAALRDSAFRRADELYLLGRIAFEQRDTAAAKHALEAAVEAAPDHVQARLYLGRTLIALGQAQEAVAALERAVELRPEHAATLAALSDAYMAAGRHERALQSAARAVRLDPRCGEHHQRLATLYAMGGRLHEARASLINALTLRPDVPAWQAQMGEICLQLGMAGAARSAFAKAAELAPDDPTFGYALARTLARQGKTAEARVALDRAVAAAPEQGEWRYELARILEELGEREAARTHLIAAAQFAPDVVEHWRALAAAQREAGDVECARETLERALLRFGDSAPLHLALGAILEEQGETPAAIWHYEQAAASAPNVAEHWWRLGRAQLENGDAAEARKSLERALALDPDAAEAHAALAQIFAAEEDDRAALAHIQRAAELAPDVALYQAQLADAYAHMRRYDEARQALERATRLQPDDAELLARYGEMALAVGLNREALQAFERAIEKQPDEARYHFLAGRAHRRLKHYGRAIERFRRAVKLRPGYSEAIVELSTLGPLAFVAQHLRRDDQAA